MKLWAKSDCGGTKAQDAPSTDVQTADMSAPFSIVPTATKPGPPGTTLIICAPTNSAPPTRRHVKPSDETQAAARSSSTEVRSLPTAITRPSLDVTPAMEALANTSLCGTVVHSCPSVDTQTIALSIPSKPTATNPGPPVVTEVTALPVGPGNVVTRSRSIELWGMLGVALGGEEAGGFGPSVRDPTSNTMPRSATAGASARIKRWEFNVELPCDDYVVEITVGSRSSKTHGRMS
jgi:hypothetical protein